MVQEAPDLPGIRRLGNIFDGLGSGTYATASSDTLASKDHSENPHQGGSESPQNFYEGGMTVRWAGAEATARRIPHRRSVRQSVPLPSWYMT